MGDAPRPQRSTLTQMSDALSTLLMIDAPTRLHQSRALRRSEADLLKIHLKDARDYIAATASHKDAIRALLSGEQLVPLSAALAAGRDMAEEGGE